jgi:serine O-acetyltransferase
MVDAVREDHAMMRHYDGRYGVEGDRGNGIARDAVTRIGFQLMVAYRAMRFCVDAKIPLAPRVASRLIRHVYGSDIHWETTLEPGVVVVHGIGMALSRGAYVERGAALFHHVTLGMSMDPHTRAVGAPRVERDASIGAGTTVVGPVTIGSRTKITGNCFVRSSVPADSIVEAASPVVRPRARRSDG